MKSCAGRLQIALALSAALGCGRGRGTSTDAGVGPAIASFASTTAAVFLGQRAELTAVFTGGSGTIEGIGPVESGTPVPTPPLLHGATFTLRVGDGAEQVEATAEVQVAYHERLRALQDAPIGRGAHLAAALPGGGAVLAGGHISTEPNVPDSFSSELFDAATEKATIGPDLPFTVIGPPDSSTSTQLKDGTMLVVGAGPNNFDLGTNPARVTATFRPADKRFVRTGDTNTQATFGATLVALADGGALLTGGASSLSPLRAAERFDPATGLWTLWGNLIEPRVGHSATLLRDGRVLMAGGIQCCKAVPGGVSTFVVDTAEVFDPVSKTSQSVGHMVTARGLHKATLLPDGRVLISGGLADDPFASPTSAETWDPATGQFAPAGDGLTPRIDHAAILRNDGRVLVVGGTPPTSLAVGVEPTEIFDPETNRWTEGPPLQPAWPASTATLLDNGKVLVFGGEIGGGSAASTVLLLE